MCIIVKEKSGNIFEKMVCLHSSSEDVQHLACHEECVGGGLRGLEITERFKHFSKDTKDLAGKALKL